MICEASFLSATSDDTRSLSTILLSAYRVHERVLNPSAVLISAEPTRALSNAFHCCTYLLWRDHSDPHLMAGTVPFCFQQHSCIQNANLKACNRMDDSLYQLVKLRKTMRCLKSCTRSVAYLCSMLLVSLPGLACISLATQCLLVLSSCPMYGHTV